MLQVARRYVLLFVVTGVPFGVVTGLTSSSAVVGLVCGFPFGVVMSLILGTLDLVGSRTGGRQRSLGPRQGADLVVAADLPVVRATISDALVALPARLVDGSPDALEARTGLSARSFGEVIRVELESGTGGTHVRVRSRPRIPTTVVDYGRGRQHVDAVVAALRSSFPVGDAAGDAAGPPTG